MATDTILPNIQKSQSAEETQTAGQIIEHFQQEAPVNVVGIADALGINVWEDNLTPISGKLFIDKLNGGKSGFSIVINSTESLPRKRFTVAHEIAHFILHREDLENGIVEDALFRNSGLSSKKETEANKLAADILMPYPLITKLMENGIRTIEDLADALEVSKAAISIRLGVPYAD
jgi:Zn-dependent peptidase ImmA (M78 family)